MQKVAPPAGALDSSGQRHLHHSHVIWANASSSRVPTALGSKPCCSRHSTSLQAVVGGRWHAGQVGEAQPSGRTGCAADHALSTRQCRGKLARTWQDIASCTPSALHYEAGPARGACTANKGPSRDLAAVHPLHGEHARSAQRWVGGGHRHVTPPRHTLGQLLCVAGLICEVQLVPELPVAGEMGGGDGLQ